MKDEITIASWNIAGAHKMKSFDMFDYEGEDVAYFASQLGAQNPDIICLQETHSSSERSVAREIARRLGFEYVYEQPMSPSHIDPAYELGMAVLSKEELEPVVTFKVPYPSFPLAFSDGRPAAVHEKGVQVFMRGGVMIANLQLLPLTVFGARYDEGEGRELARQIEQTFLERLRAPLIFAGDFNFDSPRTVYPALYEAIGLEEALPSTTTRPNKEGAKKTPDHILYSKELAAAGGKVVKVQADHYLCTAKLKLG